MRFSKLNIAFYTVSLLFMFEMTFLLTHYTITDSNDTETVDTEDVLVVMDKPAETVSVQQAVEETEPEETVSEPEVQEVEVVEEPEPEVEEVVEEEPQQSYPGVSAASFKSAGVLYDSNWKYTYYSSNVLYHYRTSEWTPGSDGVYRDSEGYVVVASSDMSQGAVFWSDIFGYCKVYDRGCASGTIDVYTNY